MPIVTKSALDGAIRKADIEALLGIIDELDRESRNEVLKAISAVLTQGTKTATLTQIRRAIQIADDQVKNWVVKAISEAYVEGLNIADGQLRSLGVSVPAGKVTVEQIRTIADMTIHRDAVNALIADTYLDFGNGMNGLIKGVEHQLNEALKRQARAKILTGQLTGQSMRDIAKEVKEVLGNQGFSVLIDRGGRQWTLGNYSEMLARTHIIKSGNEGLLTRAAEFETDIVQISQHAGACTICIPFEGKTYSISGKSDEHEKLTEFPPFHPNCRHSLLLRPDLE